MHVELLRDDVRRMQGEQTLCFDAVALRHCTAPAHMLAACLGGEHTGPRPLADQRALKLCKCGHDVKEQRAAGRRGIDALSKRGELNAAHAEVVDELNKFRERAPQTVKTPYNQRIAFRQSSHRLFQTRPREACARHTLIGEDVVAPRIP